MHRTRRPWTRRVLLAGAFVAAALTAPAALRAGDDPAPKSKISKEGHLQYRRTYEGALLEARIRNLPVFVSRHKDF
jgi:hypothetical protein